MTKHSSPPTPSHSHSGPHRVSPTTPISTLPTEPKALTPSNKLRTYKRCLHHDSVARNTAISAFKSTDTYIYEMDHCKRYNMLQAIAADVDAKRIEAGEHVSCLFEKVVIEETPLSPEEAMEKWVETRKEVEGKRSGLRGRKKVEVRMLPKKTCGLESVKTKSVEEKKRDSKEEQGKKPERVTSKGIPLVMLDDDDDD